MHKDCILVEYNILNMNPFSKLITCGFFVILLKCTLAAKPCDMCHGNRVPAEYREIVIDVEDGFEYNCEGYASSALFSDETDDVCEAYFQLIGHAKCGCPISDENMPSPREQCSLCIDGSTPPDEYKFARFEVTEFGRWEAGGITCLDVSGYAPALVVGSDSCVKYQELGVKNCGCPDILPSNPPSSNPTYVDERKADCDALNEGRFPSIESPYLKNTVLDYNLNMNLAAGVTIADVASALQDELSRSVSLETVAGCSSSYEEIDGIIVHYVKFEGLTGSVKGLASGKNRVVFSELPESSMRVRRLVDKETLSALVTKIINDNSEAIAENVEGVDGLIVPDDEVDEADKDDRSNTSTANNTGVAVGVSIGCTVAVLAAGYLVSKNKRLKKSLPRDVEKIDFLPNEQILRSVQVRSDQQGIEMYPEDFELEKTYDDYEEEISMGEGCANIFDVERVDRTAPKYGINEAFPIDHNVRIGPFQDSDSSDSDNEMPSDEEWENKPLAVRKKASYSVQDTMEL